MPPKLKPSADDGLTSPSRLLLVRLLFAVALGLACYLAYVSLSGGSLAGCGPESDCDRVLRSRWAYWFGLPVSLVALPLYVAILLGTFRLRVTVPIARQRQAWVFIVPCAVIVIGAAIWFTALQVFVIKALCKFCLTAHASGFLASVVLLLSAPFRSPPEKPWQLEKQVFVPPRLLKNFALAALAGFGLLVAGQTLHQRKTFVVVPVPGGADARTKTNPASLTQTSPHLTTQTQLPPANPAATATQANTPATPLPTPPPVPSTPTNATAAIPPASTNGMKRPLLIYGGLFALDVHELPLIGPANAPHLMVSLYDYTCHHCRTMHGRLLEIQHLFSNDLAIINLPMPLDPKCNQTMTRTHPDHVNACEYGRLGLAVWRANRQLAPTFDEWVFAPEKPPPVEQARLYAAQLVEKAAFDKALLDPWVETQLKQDVDIYETAYRAGQGSMPQLIIGLKVAVGTLAVPDVLAVMAEQLKLTTP